MDKPHACVSEMTKPVALQRKIRHRLDPERYEREAFANCGGATASAIEISTILDQLSSLEGDSILELGVGPGRILKKLVGRGFRIVGMDYDPNMVYFSARRTRNDQDIDLLVADGQNLPFRGGVFDAIICIRVLKYFSLPQEGVREICSALKSNGLLLLEFPNLFGLSALAQIFQLLRRTDFFPRLFKLSTVEEFVTENSVRIQSEQGMFKIPPKIWTLARSKTLVGFLVSFEKILHKITPVEMLSKSIILQGKKA